MRLLSSQSLATIARCRLNLNQMAGKLRATKLSLLAFRAPFVDLPLWVHALHGLLAHPTKTEHGCCGDGWLFCIIQLWLSLGQGCQGISAESTRCYILTESNCSVSRLKTVGKHLSWRSSGGRSTEREWSRSEIQPFFISCLVACPQSVPKA